MARVRIKRSKSWHSRVPSAVRALVGLALLALPASCIQSLAGARTPVASVNIVLDQPAPYSSAADPVQLLLPVATAVEPVMTGAVDLLATELPTPFIMPEASAFSAGPAAAPYVFRGKNSTDTLRASLCLTAAIYYEAANEPDEGQRAVAQVVLNRVRHPAWPNTVCDVVYQGTERPGTLCQFTFGCDGAMARTPALASWFRARRVAQAALAGYVYEPAGLATHYHTLAVSPSWGKTLTPVGIIGAHIFYRLPGGAGAPKAFYSTYRGNEPTPGPRAKIGVPTDPLIFATAGEVMPQALTVTPTVPVAVTPATSPTAPAVSADRRYVSGSLPESDIRDEYRNSGQWIAR